MRCNSAHNSLAVTAFGCFLLAGCSSPRGGPAPLTEADPPAQREGQRCPQVGAAGNTALMLFGDDPQQESVPFENRLVTNLRQHTFTTEGLDFDPDIASDGQTLLYASTRNSEHPDIFLKKVEGTALVQLTADPADDIQPRFSPDGQRIAFCSNRSGNWDLWLINRDGLGLTQLTHDRSDAVAPCWSPDGTEIAYTVWGYRSHQWEIWTLVADKPGVRRFLAYGMFPEWSPDGKRVAFQRARQRGSQWFSIWIVDLVGGEARHPTEVAHSDVAACIAPGWSPDGSMVVYCAVRPESARGPTDTRVPVRADLWTVDLETGLRMKLTSDSAAVFNPVWGPNGRVFFVSARGGTENIWSLTAELVAYSPQAGDAPRVTRAPAIGGVGLNSE